MRSVLGSPFRSVRIAAGAAWRFGNPRVRRKPYSALRGAPTDLGARSGLAGGGRALGAEVQEVLR